MSRLGVDVVRLGPESVEELLGSESSRFLEAPEGLSGNTKSRPEKEELGTRRLAEKCRSILRIVWQDAAREGSCRDG
jgi:hypothetical protein